MPAISHFMTKQPWTIARKATLADAHRLMRAHDIRHLPVIDNGELVGVVSQGDLHLLETIADFELEGVAVEEAMSSRPFYVTADTPIDEVVEIMADHKYGSCIVMGRNGVEGIFTGVDACRTLAALVRRYENAEVPNANRRHTGYSR
ncbi:MAG TPA: CBS domain-containing protein [Kofleriaceae bacterium]